MTGIFIIVLFIALGLTIIDITDSTQLFYFLESGVTVFDYFILVISLFFSILYYMPLWLLVLPVSLTLVFLFAVVKGNSK